MARAAQRGAARRVLFFLPHDLAVGPVVCALSPCRYTTSRSGGEWLRSGRRAYSVEWGWKILQWEIKIGSSSLSGRPWLVDALPGLCFRVDFCFSVFVAPSFLSLSLPPFLEGGRG